MTATVNAAQLLYNTEDVHALGDDAETDVLRHRHAEVGVRGIRTGRKDAHQRCEDAGFLYRELAGDAGRQALRGAVVPQCLQDIHAHVLCVDKGQEAGVALDAVVHDTDEHVAQGEDLLVAGLVDNLLGQVSLDEAVQGANDVEQQLELPVAFLLQGYDDAAVGVVGQISIERDRTVEVGKEVAAQEVPAVPDIGVLTNVVFVGNAFGEERQGSAALTLELAEEPAQHAGHARLSNNVRVWLRAVVLHEGLDAGEGRWGGETCHEAVVDRLQGRVLQGQEQHHRGHVVHVLLCEGHDDLTIADVVEVRRHGATRRHLRAEHDGLVREVLPVALKVTAAQSDWDVRARHRENAQELFRTVDDEVATVL
eukprot:PhM_4_TR2645/c0_g1_i1/m.76425